jgi:outer membrane murein-binding lipoprotein Lpp
MTGDIHEVSRLIGGLESSVGSLQKSIESLNTTWGEREKSASEGRRVVHAKVDELRDDVTRLSAEVENVSKDLSAIKPAIDDFKAARNQQIGAQKLGKVLWGAFLAAAGGAGYLIGEWLHIFWPPKH